jgi:hypothetical protein
LIEQRESFEDFPQKFSETPLARRSQAIFAHPTPEVEFHNAAHADATTKHLTKKDQTKLPRLCDLILDAACDLIKSLCR